MHPNITVKTLPYRSVERLEGVPRDTIIATTSVFLDWIYHARSVSAWAAIQLEGALAYKGFLKSRRPFAEAQIEFLRRVASGDHVRVAHERDRHFSSYFRPQGVPRYIEELLTLEGTGATDSTVTDRTVLASAAYECLNLRQLAAYESGVAIAHEVPSSPKGVRSILLTVSQALETVSLGERADVDHRGALAAIGAPDWLTVPSYRAELGL